MNPNVVLIVCDTLRKDVLELYGGPAKTPFLNRLAKDSMVYDNCISPSPWTFPSHVSLFTGMYLHEHNVHESKTDKLPQIIAKHTAMKAGRLPEYMKHLGYTTLGISNNIGVSRFTDFDVGFDSFTNIENSPWWQGKEVKKAREIGSDASDVLKQLIKQGKLMDIYTYAKVYMRIKSLLKATNYPLNKGAELTNNILLNSALKTNFFLFLNFMEMHEPYIDYREKEMMDDFTGVKKMSPSRTKLMKRRYTEEAEYLDEQIGNTIQMLKERGLYDDSLIIVTSDHGQAFNEHGYLYHEIYLYDEIVRVPLIVKYPKGRKFKKAPGYQSLVGIPALIKDIIEGGDDSALTTKTVYSEAYGNTRTYPKSYAHRTKYILDNYEKLRKAVYRDGYKLTVNGTDGTIEEFMKGDKALDYAEKGNRKIVAELLAAIEGIRESRGFKMPEL